MKRRSDQVKNAHNVHTKDAQEDKNDRKRRLYDELEQCARRIDPDALNRYLAKGERDE